MALREAPERKTGDPMAQEGREGKGRGGGGGGGSFAEHGSLQVFHHDGKEKGSNGAKNISPRDKVLTSSSGWSGTPVKHIRENGSLKSEATPNQEAEHDRDRGRDMGVREVWRQ